MYLVKTSIAIECFVVFIFFEFFKKKDYLFKISLVVIPIIFIFTLIKYISLDKNLIFYNFDILLNSLSNRTSHNLNLYQNIFGLFYKFIIILILPFKINLIDAFKDLGFSRIIFIPFIISHYFFIYYLIKSFFSKTGLTKEIIFISYFFFSTIIIQILAGRFYLHTILGYLFVIIFIFHKQKIKINKIIILIITLLSFLFKFSEAGILKNNSIYINLIKDDFFKTNLKIYNLQNEIHINSINKIYSFLKNNKFPNKYFYCFDSTCLYLTYSLNLKNIEYFSYISSNVFDKNFNEFCIHPTSMDDCGKKIFNDLRVKNPDFLILDSKSYFYSHIDNFSDLINYINYNYNFINYDGIYLYSKK